MKKIAFLMAALLVSVISFGQNGLNFDGVNDHLVTTNPGPVGNTSRTVELWFKLGSLTPTTQKVLVDWGAMTPNGSRFTLNILSNRLRIEVGGNGANGTTTLTTGVWNHVATVYDAATSTHTLYLNGVQEFSGPLTVAVNTLSTNPIQVGRRNDGINFFGGDIDEVRIWNVARTASEINATMNAEICAANSNLVAYYKFNQGLAGGNNAGLTTENDFSGNLNTATLNNFALTGATSNFNGGSGAAICAPVNNAIPTTSQWGLLIIALGLISVATIVIKQFNSKEKYTA